MYYVVIGSVLSPESIVNGDEDYTFLDGAKSSFTWDMDTSADITTTFRKHTGYIRIMDNGEDSDGNPFDWRTLIPEGIKSKKFSFWKYTEDVQAGREYYDLLACGYLQPDNFTASLQALPVERAYPVACPLEAVGDLKFEITGGRSADTFTFAEVLYALISSTDIAPDYIYFPGVSTSNWLETDVQAAHYYDFAHTSGGSELPRTAKLTNRDALDEFCTLFGLSLTIIGKDWYFTDIKHAAYTQYTRMTMDYLYAFPNGAAADRVTFDIQEVTRAFPTNILAKSKMEVRKGWKKVNVTMPSSGDDDILDMDTDEMVKEYSGGEWEKDYTLVYSKRVGEVVADTSAGYKLRWVGVGCTIETTHFYSDPHDQNTEVEGACFLWLPKTYINSQGSQVGLSLAESIQRNTPSVALRLKVLGMRESGDPLIRLETDTVKFTEGAYITFKFNVWMFKNYMGEKENFSGNGYLICHIRNLVSGKCYNSVNNTWESTLVVSYIMLTDGKSRNTYEAYSNILRNFDGFGIFSGDEGFGKFRIDILGYWGDASFRESSYMCISDFSVSLVHTKTQELYEGDTDVTAENSLDSVEEKRVDLAFTQSLYVRNSPHSINRYFKYDTTPYLYRAAKIIATDLSNWGAHPREYLTLEWRGTPSLPIDMHTRYTLTLVGESRTYRMLAYKMDYEQNRTTLKLIEVD